MAEEALSRFEMPALIKPSQGHLFARVFGTKMFQVGDRADAMKVYDLCAAEGLEMMIQEIIKGPPQAGVNHIVLARGGDVLAEFTAQKIRNWPAEYGSPSAVRSKWVPEVVAATRALLKATRYDGVACAEYKRDETDGRYKLMEVNVRHNLSGALAPSCGVDFPWLQYELITGSEIEFPSTFSEGMYWVDSLRDLRHLAREPWRHSRSLLEFFAPYYRRGVDARAAWRDLTPFVDATLQRLAGVPRFVWELGCRSFVGIVRSPMRLERPRATGQRITWPKGVGKKLR
jgi:predicted ATP-grasp superfamily ATP-dependent carboligase